MDPAVSPVIACRALADTNGNKRQDV
ncbi:hypothetical protein QC764_0034180 [Podospora pseudoanserina]|uniref:Uncharacterized protein n=1 Tax=Podospora pseudoanserina TaxID=2609844 RepID=A0ABR0IG42_9PEZI|nr:hypothetical protein QC764_0034180 [Podospora pseudoanserina]